ncbi:MAG: acyl-CoA carboxylase subunit epsilon [Pseudonocardiales bacterium]|nr:acyl-CoA carboxylase subunit epsilon [Pseudonocardiales bacterium]
MRIADNATDEELAALVVALATLANAAAAGPSASCSARTGSAWTDRARGLRTPLYPGPNTWRNSAWRNSALP